MDEPLTQNDGIQITTPEQSVSPEMFGALWGDEDPSYIPEPHLDLTSQDSPSSSVYERFFFTCRLFARVQIICVSEMTIDSDLCCRRSGSSVHSDTTVEMEVDSHYRYCSS